MQYLIYHASNNWSYVSKCCISNIPNSLTNTLPATSQIYGPHGTANILAKLKYFTKLDFPKIRGNQKATFWAPRSVPWHRCTHAPWQSSQLPVPTTRELSDPTGLGRFTDFAPLAGNLETRPHRRKKARDLNGSLFPLLLGFFLRVHWSTEDCEIACLLAPYHPHHLLKIMHRSIPWSFWKNNPKEYPNSNDMMGRFLRIGGVWVRHVNNSYNFGPRTRLGDKCKEQLAEPSKI